MSEMPDTIDVLLDQFSPGDAQLSPDGRLIAYAFGRANKPDADTPHPSAIHILDTNDGQSRQLAAASAGNNRAPRWSPDGRRLAFLAKRAGDGATGLYLTDAGGELAELLSSESDDASAPAWLPNGSGIAFLSRERREQADPYVVDADVNFARLALISLADGQQRFISPAEFHVHEFALSPDGKQALVLASDHPNPMQGWYGARLFLLSLDSGQWRPLLPRTQHQVGRLCWSPDGGAIAYVSGVCSDEGNVAGEVFVVELADGRARNITTDIDHSIAWIDWREEGILYGARHIEASLLGWLHPQTGARRTICRGVYAINGGGPEIVSARGRQFAAIRESHTEPPQLYLGSLDDGEWRQVSAFEYPLAALPPLQVGDRYWQHVDGTPTHAYLALPAGYESGRALPMVANVHGGPANSIIPRYFNPWVRVFLELGCAVLLPNPRGSWGRGHAYQAANVGDLGGGDWQDIMVGIDAMVSEGLADPDRLAIMGWSYAGFLSTWAVTQTDRFRCSIAGANITNYVSNYGVVLNREWQSTLLGSNVYEDIDLHWSRSPIQYAKRARTPTLLVHGAEDVVAPPEQSVEFYTALRHFGVPAELVLYPREPHGLQERAHQRDLMLRMRRWLQTYLFAETA